MSQAKHELEKTIAQLNDSPDSVIKIPVPGYKGNFFYPGAGFDGSYIDSLEQKLKEVGLENVHVDRGSVDDTQTQGMVLDVLAIMMMNDVFKGGSAQPSRLDHIFRFPSGGTQLNFLGYSYGALIAAYNAMQYTNVKRKDVDHLVLIAAPITDENLALIQANPRIKKLIIHDLTQHGDRIRAGMRRGQLRTSVHSVAINFALRPGEGHFYYTKKGPEGEERRRSLAQYLYSEGLR
jgi:hypothetical protein